MKHIIFALSLGLLFFVSSCIGKPGGKPVQNNEQTTTENVKSEIVSELSQDYFTMEEYRPAISGEIKNGGLWLTFNKDQILPLGITDDDAYRLSEGPVKVEGLKGSPKNFIIADIGQDYNPILCVLTDQGKVQLLSLWDVVATGNLEAIEITMNPIVRFKSGPGGPSVDEDGTVFYDYTTIYGVDAQGNEFEMPLYFLDNDLEYVTKIQGTDVVYQLHLGDDWRMQYVVGYYLSDKVEELQGRFWPINENWDDMVYRFGYELTTRMEYLDEGVKTTEVKQTGVFEIQYPDLDSHIRMVTPIEGVDFGNMGMNVPVPFGLSSAYGG